MWGKVFPSLSIEARVYSKCFYRVQTAEVPNTFSVSTNMLFNIKCGSKIFLKRLYNSLFEHVGRGFLLINSKMHTSKQTN